LTPFFFLFNPSTRIKTKAGTFTNRLPQARWSPGNGDVADKSANVAGAPALRSQEGIMAKTDFPLTIDRRRLLATGAAAATAAIAPGAGSVEAALANAAQPASLPAEAPPLNVCAATARRLLDIARRNEIRREAGLPLLSTVKELRRLKQYEDGELFERFKAQHRDVVWEEVLKPRRAAEGNPNWFPRNWAEGLGYQSEVYKILRERFAAAGR
jgi:hypothetical protein